MCLLTIDEVIAGNVQHGGEDFDDCLVNYFVQEFKRKRNKGRDSLNLSLPLTPFVLITL
jgi:molecular chaperone DnaK (HSP70)